MPINDKQRAILDYICEVLDKVEPSGDNARIFRDQFSAMSEAEFHKAMEDLRDGKWQLAIYIPNFMRNLDINRLNAVAKELGAVCFQRITMTDQATGIRYTTPNEYPILPLPVARTQQDIGKKMSTSDTDRRTDALTGQKTADDRAAALTNPEIHVLDYLGLTESLTELVRIRGGDVPGYAAFRTQLETTGEADITDILPHSRTRVSVVLAELLRAMHLDNNIAG